MDVKIPAKLEAQINELVAENKAKTIAALDQKLAGGSITKEVHDDLVKQINDILPSQYIVNMVIDALITWKRGKVIQVKNEELKTEIDTFRNSIL